MSSISNIGGSSPTPTYIDSPTFQSLPPSVQDTLLKSFTIEELNARFAPTASAPVLVSPSIMFSDSLDDFFKIIAEAKVELNNQLSASDLVDQSTRRKETELASLFAQQMSNNISKRDLSVKEAKLEAKQAVEDIEDLLQDIADKIDAQQNAISSFNATNNTEKGAFNNLVSIYNTYITDLAANGITSTGTRTYSVPANKITIYNNLTTIFRDNIDSFNNNYLYGRLYSDILSFNIGVLNYNSSASNNNSALQDFITDYDLQAFLTSANITTPTQPTATFRSTTGMPLVPLNPIFGGTPTIVGPPLIPTGTTTATTITVNSPHLGDYGSAFISIATNGPPTIPNLTQIASFDVDELEKPIYNSLYKKNVTPIDNEIEANMAYWAYLQALQLFNPPQDYTPDPLLNFKPFARKLLPNTITEPTQVVKTHDSAGGGGLSVQSIGLAGTHITGILGKAALTQAVNNLGLKLTEEQINELADQLLVLSVGLISKESLAALLPSLGPILSASANLPKDSPAFSLLFAISFANRIQELVGQEGLTAEALKSFLEGGLLQNLSEGDLNALAASLNLGLLLTSAKLIESSLGLPGLSAQTVLPLLPPDVATTVLTQAAIENDQASADLRSQLQAYYTTQGFNEDESTFLSEVGKEAVKQDLLSPTPPSITSANVNQQLLTDSIKANILLSARKDIDLARADVIAREAVARAFEDFQGPSISTTQFRQTLASHLEDLGLRSATASDIAREAFIILKNSIPEKLIIPPSLKDLLLAQGGIQALIISRMNSLLTAQFGASLSEKVKEELNKTLYGTPNPDPYDLAGVKQPLSLVNSIKKQLETLNVEHNKDYALAVSDAFKETLLTTKDFYSFSLKIMDPANSLIYSSATGIMYGGHEPSNWKKSIDIIV